MEVILDHNKNPRNKGHIKNHTNHADGHNPLCGDKVSLDLIIENDSVKDVKFTGCGCAISTASSSILTEYIIGISGSFYVTIAISVARVAGQICKPRFALQVYVSICLALCI